MHTEAHANQGAVCSNCLFGFLSSASDLRSSLIGARYSNPIACDKARHRGDASSSAHEHHRVCHDSGRVEMSLCRDSIFCRRGRSVRIRPGAASGLLHVTRNEQPDYNSKPRPGAVAVTAESLLLTFTEASKNRALSLAASCSLTEA